MSPLLVFIVLVLGALAAPARALLAAEPARELVVQLSESAVGGAGFRMLHAGAVPAAARARFASLGLRATRAMSERLGARAKPLPDIYGFHPERIVLLEAVDSALITSAL